MKKVLVFVLCFFLVIGVTACSNKKTAEFSVDVFWADFSDEYASVIRSAMETKLTAAGIDYEFHDAEKDEEKQIEQVEEALKGGSHLVVIDQVKASTTASSISMINFAKEYDVPLIFFNDEMADSVVNAYKGSAVFVGHKLEALANLQGEMIAETLLSDYSSYDRNGDGVITYVMYSDLSGTASDSVARYTVAKTNELLDDEDKEALAYYDEENTTLYNECNNKNKLVADSLAEILESNDPNGKTPIELIIATNDDVALQAVAALQEAGFNTGDGDAIPVFGFYATEEGIASVEAGGLTGTIQRQPEVIGQTTADIIIAIKNGVSIVDIVEGYDDVEKAVDKIRIAGVKILKTTD